LNELQDYLVRLSFHGFTFRIYTDNRKLLFQTLIVASCFRHFAMVSVSRHIVLLQSDGNCRAEGPNDLGKCDIPPLPEGLSYTQVSAGEDHTVLLRSDGSVVACGNAFWGHCDIPALEQGVRYTQVSAGATHTVLLRSDGRAVAIGRNFEEQCNIPHLDEGMSYIQVSAGGYNTMLLRNDGAAVPCSRHAKKWKIPALDHGLSYTQISTGMYHTVLLRSDGTAVACGEIHPWDEDGMLYTQVSAGNSFTVLLGRDGRALACGDNTNGQCNIPPLDAGTFYTQISAGEQCTLLLRSDGCAVACGAGFDEHGTFLQPEPGICYVSEFTTLAEDLVLQLDLVCEDHAVVLTCLGLAGEEVLRLNVINSELAWDTHKRIARELNFALARLRLVLPDGHLLAEVCRGNPVASISDVSKTRERIP
jgi:alpha-tubulin suppressor-like RCC1 family protein